MATTQETIKKLLNREEVIYWAKKNGVRLEEFPGGFWVGEWTITFDQEDKIAAVERRLDVPTEL
jgi:hypothetical protein